MITILGSNDNLSDYSDKKIVDVSCWSKEWGRHLSPMFLGPVNVHPTYWSKTLHNAIHYSKLFPEYVGAIGRPVPEYLKWAEKGWRKNIPKTDKEIEELEAETKKPFIAYNLHGETLNELQARQRFYIPLYKQAIHNASSYGNYFDRLERTYFQTHKDLILFDTTGYNHRALNMNYNDVINNVSVPFSHAFVLGMLLENYI